MREIKFRGKLKRTGEWVYGGYYKRNDNFCFIVDDSWTERNAQSNYNYVSWVFNGVEVLPETVGQFTGMYDGVKWEEITENERKAWTRRGNFPSEWKGREIYEGDIIKCKYKNWLIEPINSEERDGDRFGLCASAEGDGECYFIDKSILGGKLIGNIHDNPELLKKNKEE